MKTLSGRRISWLRSVMSVFFPDTDFEIETLPGENDQETDLLLVRVYSSLPASEFRKRRHAIGRMMLELGYMDLYEQISIFQRFKRGIS